MGRVLCLRIRLFRTSLLRIRNVIITRVKHKALARKRPQKREEENKKQNLLQYIREQRNEESTQCGRSGRGVS